MSHVLVIKAHPRSKHFSYSLALAATFITAYRNTRPDDIITEHNISEEFGYPLNAMALSIYNKNIAGQPFSEDETAFAAGRRKWLEEFMAADKYVFVNPMYNLFLPAELKSYFDAVMQVPYTMKFTPEGKPQGLLKHKKALHLQSAGGFYHGEDGRPDLSALDVGDTYVRMVLRMMGVTDYQSLFIEGMDHEPQHADHIKQVAFTKAKALAETF
ncbi:MAG: NAD(P)H-dependent oxidoreductase [Sporolactobacillus sp.]|jgi:FMN-dependent NADH-azoreductase|nr:NAD(P)H-dependent oxidoreductase [Sporolactobacillus sp.]